MEDQQIIDLYFARSEQAIQETDNKYGGYCFSIAYNMEGDLVAGANIAGFLKVAEAMKAQGCGPASSHFSAHLRRLSNRLWRKDGGTAQWIFGLLS